MTHFLRAMIVMTLLWPIAACSLFDRRDEAESIERQIGSMPGVADTDLTYTSGMATGKQLRLTVSLDTSVTQEQATDVGRTFVEQIERGEFGDHDVDFSVRYPAPPPRPNNYLYGYSEAAFEFRDHSGASDPGVTDVTDSIAVWLRTLRSPVAQQVNVRQPKWFETGTTRSIDITLRRDATAAQVQALQRGDPALAGATWIISIVNDELHRPHDYHSTPTPPSDRDKALWTQISDIVGPSYTARADTQVPVGSAQAETEIEITVSRGRDGAADTERIARAVAALLPQFGHPTALVLDGQDGPIEVVVGGCYRHRPDHQRLPLELELSAAYERC